MDASTSLKETSVLITGAGTGIGRATALLFAKNQASRIALLGRRREPLENVKKELLEISPNIDVKILNGDASDPHTLSLFFQELNQDWGSLNCLINNAGAFFQKSLQETTLKDWDSIHATNLRAPFLTIKTLLPLLKNSHGANVINISSTLSEKPIPDTFAYNATKAGLNQLTRSLALDLAKDKIRVNAILPAVVDTDLYKSRFPSPEEHAAVLKQMAKVHPLGRVGTPEDIAHAALFLTSSLASWITGVCLPVDGGMLST